MTLAFQLQLHLLFLLNLILNFICIFTLCAHKWSVVINILSSFFEMDVVCSCLATSNHICNIQKLSPATLFELGTRNLT